MKLIIPSQLRIAITPSEPASIGPDICIKLAQRSHDAELIAIADPDLLELRASQLGLPLYLKEFEPGAPWEKQKETTLKFIPVPVRQSVISGQLNQQNVHYVMDTLRIAVDRCLQGIFHAMVTGPVHKGIINEAGIPFSGHTEFLAELTHAPLPVMMLATEGLRVALATTHLPLSEVSRAITPTYLEAVIHILHHGLKSQFGMVNPNILVCGLNPHAGEGGHIGTEEINIISPVLEKLRGEGINLTGPLPADTLFTPKYLQTADAVLAMYHDQGLPVLKYLGFGQAVNITLGLPIIRTSVDHGTALDLAGTGKAQESSLEAALNMVINMARGQ